MRTSLFAVLISPLLLMPRFALGSGLLDGNGCAEYRGADGLPIAPLVELDRRVKARDGVTLSVDVYRPAHGEPMPTILQITPYGHDALVRVAICKAIAAHYSVAVGYTRGTARSEGVFLPSNKYDGPDGYDIIQWIARQPWSDQRVVMVGGSYQGQNQWQVAAELPKQLVAITPRAIAGTDTWLPFMGTGSYHWLVGHDDDRIADDGLYWAEKNLAALKGGLTLPERAKEYGATDDEANAVAQWFDPNGYDARREALSLKPAAYSAMAKAGLKVLTIAGYFDQCENTTVEAYVNWRTAAAAAHNDALFIIGPWPHDLSTSRNEGGLRFAADSVLDLNALTLAWFEHVLRGKPLPEFLSKPVSYYQMGLDEGWHHVDSLEEMSTGTRRLYLSATAGEGKNWFAAGELRDAPRAGVAPVAMRRDPRNIGYTQEAQLRQDYVNPATHIDPMKLLSSDDKLVYVSAPSAASVTISGRPHVTIYASLDVPDADFFAYLYAIEPDGRTIVLGTGAMRARYSESRYAPSLVESAAEIRAYHFDFEHDAGQFQLTSRRYPAGTRLAFVIGPPTELWGPWNYQTGGIVGAEDPAQARVATFKVFQSGRYASHIDLPIRAE